MVEKSSRDVEQPCVPLDTYELSSRHGTSKSRVPTVSERIIVSTWHPADDRGGSVIIHARTPKDVGFWDAGVAIAFCNMVGIVFGLAPWNGPK